MSWNVWWNLVVGRISIWVSFEISSLQLVFKKLIGHLNGIEVLDYFGFVFHNSCFLAGKTHWDQVSTNVNVWIAWIICLLFFLEFDLTNEFTRNDQSLGVWSRVFFMPPRILFYSVIYYFIYYSVNFIILFYFILILAFPVKTRQLSC